MHFASATVVGVVLCVCVCVCVCVCAFFYSNLCPFLKLHPPHTFSISPSPL